MKYLLAFCLCVFSVTAHAEEKRIIYPDGNGGINIIIPAYKDKIAGQQIGESESAFLARVIAREIAVGNMTPSTQYLIVDQSKLPQDRSKRSGWILNGSSIVVDETRVQKNVSQTEKLQKFLASKFGITPEQLKQQLDAQK